MTYFKLFVVVDVLFQVYNVTAYILQQGWTLSITSLLVLFCSRYIVLRYNRNTRGCVLRVFVSDIMCFIIINTIG